MTQYKATSPIGRFAIGDIVSDFSDRQIAIYINQGLIKKVKPETEVIVTDDDTKTSSVISNKTDKDKNTDGK